MTERRKDTGFWSHPFVQGLPSLAKLLLDYLWTGPDCNQAGLYYLTTKTIAFDTGIDENQIPELMKLLEPKVKWWPEINLVWAKTFLKRQGRSPKFLVAVARCLENINHPEIVAEFLDFNKSHYGLEIPYQEGLRPSKAVPTHPAIGIIPIKLEMDLQEVLKSLPGWQHQEQEDFAWLRTLTEDFPNVTVLNLKACGDFFSDKKPATKGPWKSRIRNWLKIEK